MEADLKSTNRELSGLRLFRDAVLASDTTLVLRKGGGYLTLDAYLREVENRIEKSVLNKAFSYGNEDEGHRLAHYYGMQDTVERVFYFIVYFIFKWWLKVAY